MAKVDDAVVLEGVTEEDEEDPCPWVEFCSVLLPPGRNPVYPLELSEVGFLGAGSGACGEVYGC